MPDLIFTRRKNKGLVKLPYRLRVALSAIIAGCKRKMGGAIALQLARRDFAVQANLHIAYDSIAR